VSTGNVWKKFMRRVRAVTVTLSFLLGASLVDVTSACAQNGGPRVSGFFGTSLGEGDAAILTGGSVGYRFTPRFGFDLEVLAMPDTDFDRIRFDRTFDAIPPTIGGIPIRRPDVETSGHTVAFLTNFVTELPTGAKWLIPYIAGGGGVASVSRSVAFGPIYALPIGLPMPVTVLDVAGFPITLPDIGTLGEIGRIERSETDLALTIGGGVDFQVAKGLAVGADLRYLHLFGTTDDLALTRMVGRVTYRF
jgi:Outer membrane protein beta-barrel domain